MTLRTALADRRLHLAAIGLAGLALVLLIVLAAIPWGAFKSTIEARLSKQFGRPVTIARVERLDAFSLVPTIALRDVRVPQAAWAGSGDLARIGEVQIKVAIVPLLFGRFHPHSIMVSHARLSLVRDATRRTNWTRDGAARDSGGGSVPVLEDLRIADTIIDYRDAVQKRHLVIRLAADPSNGLRLTGTGTIQGAAVNLAASAPAIGPSTAGRRWPFHAQIEGAALAMDVRGTMERPLDARHLDMQVSARADDLKLIDAVIEAGLFGTQPVRLSAHARRDGAVWTIDPVRGTIGRSDIAGMVTVTKGKRTTLDGSLTSNALNFDDFASNAGMAAAVALEQAQGLKIVPNTLINLRKIDDTDGTIAFDVRRIVGGRRPSSLTSLKGKVTIDRQLMTAPLTVGLKRGTIAGVVTVDQRGGGAVPIVTLDLTMRGSSIAALAGGGDGQVDARVDGRVRLRGPGSTIREAVGASSGTIGVVARDGGLPAKIAALIGFDVARGLTTDKDQRAGLRCAVARFVVSRGTGRASPLIIDTTLSQSRATGTLAFPAESLALALTGAPKQKSLLRLPGSIAINGKLRAPHIVVPPETKSAGNIFKAIGRAISGNQGPRATDADCGALAAQALG